MSRNLRKLFGTDPKNNLPPLEGNSDEEFEPLYAKKQTTYAGLEVSSVSSSEDNEEPDDVENVAVNTEKKKKKKKKKPKKPRADPIIPEGVELDEIDRSVLEVNALLGDPEPAQAETSEKKVDPVKQLLSVKSKNLNFENEIIRMFGSVTPNEDGKVKKCRPHNVTKYRRSMIAPTPENYHFQKIGLSMSLLCKEGGYSYFAFNHSREYYKMHQAYLDVLDPPDVVPTDDSKIHLEALLKTTDFLFRIEEYTSANTVLTQIISYYQNAAHPYFNMTDQCTRLEYKYTENRPFFIAVLKYLYMLTNKACHRTALELVKLLLNLDPSDPLALIYIIDVIALRAREHQWLIDIIDYWNVVKDAKYLFNLRYSYALANFHTIKKRKMTNFADADSLLKEAMLAFPNITVQILECARNELLAKIQKHPLFSAEDKFKPSDKLEIAMTLYSKLVCGKYREPPVMEWFLRNANELMEEYDTDPNIKKKAEELMIVRNALFRSCPKELQRHLFVVYPMCNFLIEWEMPSIGRARTWDPLPPANGVNRYCYVPVEAAGVYSVLLNMFNFHNERLERERQENNGEQDAVFAERPAERAAERPAERAAERAAERPAERPADRPVAERPATEQSAMAGRRARNRAGRGIPPSTQQQQPTQRTEEGTAVTPSTERQTAQPVVEQPIPDQPVPGQSTTQQESSSKPDAESSAPPPPNDPQDSSDEENPQAAREQNLRRTFVHYLIQAASVPYDPEFDRDWDLNLGDP